MVRNLARRVVLLASILNVWYYALVWLPQNWARTDYSRDMAIYFGAAEAFQRGGPMYHHASAAYGPWEFPTWYVNPPYLAAAITLFHGNYILFSHCWYILLVAALATFAYSLACLSGNATFERVLVWGLVLTITPNVRYVLSVGNVDVVLWALLGLAACTGKPNGLYALMLVIKPYAVWPLMVSLARNRGQHWRTPAAVLVGTTAAALAVVGWRPFMQWINWVGPSAGQGTFVDFNWSLSMSVLRLARAVGIWHYGHGPLPPGPQLFLTVLAFLVPACCVFAARRLPTTWLCIVAFFSAMAFSPLCWNCYATMLYVPFAMAIRSLPDWSHKADPGIIP